MDIIVDCIIVVKTVTKATVPYEEGSSSRAKTIDTINVTPCAPQRSKKRQIKLLVTVVLLLFIHPPP